MNQAQRACWAIIKAGSGIVPFSVMATSLRPLNMFTML